MILIDPVTRQFSVPGADLTFGVEADAGSERKSFQCPRYVGNNLDLMSCFVRMNYRNANGEMDSYLVDDVTVDGDNVVFSWVLSQKVTKYKGLVKFVVCVVGPNQKVEWHTTLGSGQVLEGLEPDIAVEPGTADVVAQLIAMVEAQTAAVEAEGGKQIKAVQAAAEAAEAASVAEIEAKRVNSLESIPDDYTALQNAVDALNHTRGAAIVCEAAGSAVVVNDASDLHIQGLRVFGKSTQDGTPTPDAPVEIKSVEKPVLRVCNKNLLPYPFTQTSKVESGVTFVDNGDGSVTANGTATSSIGFWFIGRQDHFVLPAGKYVLCPFDLPLGTQIDISISDDELSWYGAANAKTNPTTFNLDRNVYVSVRWYIPDKTVVSNATIRAMLCKDGADLEYERPKAHKKISTTHTLPGIPVASGGNYTDSDGQQWICDEVDLERGVYVRRVMLADYDGSDDERWVKSAESYFYLVKTSMTYPSKANGVALATRFVFVPGSLTQPGYFKLGNAYGPMVRVPEGVTDASGLRTWIAANPFSVVYELETPIETTLSETEIAAYRALHSNYPNTTVLNDAGAHMAVAYAADTKLYIDNKIAALIGG